MDRGKMGATCGMGNVTVGRIGNPDTDTLNDAIGTMGDPFPPQINRGL